MSVYIATNGKVLCRYGIRIPIRRNRSHIYKQILITIGIIFYFIALYYSSAITNADQRQKIEHIFDAPPYCQATLGVRTCYVTLLLLLKD